jgi:hypothetical protein
MGTRRPKKIDCSTIAGLDAAGPWVRIQGLGNLLPYPVRVPEEKLYQVTVSGSLEQPRSEVKHGQSGSVVAAWDVFRHDPGDAPFVINKEHYFVLKTGGGECWLFGPYGPEERDHWLKDVPPEFSDCQVLTGSLG